MLGIYSKNSNIKFKYHFWYLLNISNCDMQNDILSIGFHNFDFRWCNIQNSIRISHKWYMNKILTPCLDVDIKLTLGPHFIFKKFVVVLCYFFFLCCFNFYFCIVISCFRSIVFLPLHCCFLPSYRCFFAFNWCLPSVFFYCFQFLFFIFVQLLQAQNLSR